MINLATAPIDNATPELAAANMADFADEVREQIEDVTVDDPVRDPDSDRDGRYGYQLAAGDKTVHVLMPGAPLAAVRDDRSAGAPCLYVGGEAWWWPSAALQAGGAMR